MLLHFSTKLDDIIKAADILKNPEFDRIIEHFRSKLLPKKTVRFVQN